MQLDRQKIQAILTRKHMSQADLSRATKISESTITRRLKGTMKGCTFATVELLSEALDVHPRTLISWERI
mgnify:FL=1